MSPTLFATNEFSTSEDSASSRGKNFPNGVEYVVAGESTGILGLSSVLQLLNRVIAAKVCALSRRMGEEVAFGSEKVLVKRRR